jgi:hypothetical protein
MIRTPRRMSRENPAKLGDLLPGAGGRAMFFTMTAAIGAALAAAACSIGNGATVAVLAAAAAGAAGAAIASLLMTRIDRRGQPGEPSAGVEHPFVDLPRLRRPRSAWLSPAA